MSDKLFGVEEGTGLCTTAMAQELPHFQFRFEPVLKPPGRDINEILIFFAPNTMYDIRTPIIRTHINTLKQNVLGNILYNIEGHLEFEKKHICYGSPGNSSRNYDRVVDLLLKVAMDQEKRVAHRLPLVVVRSQTAFISFTENLAALVAHFRQTAKPTATTTTVPVKAYAELFRSFAEMHQLRLKDGAMFAGRAVINKQEISGTPDFVCTRNKQPVIIIKVYSDNGSKRPNHRGINNNDDSCYNRNTPMKREACAELKEEAQRPTREIHPCDNCGQLATVCSELSYLTTKTGTLDVDLQSSLQEEVAADMLVAVCREDVPPYFSNPPRILAIIVEGTRVRFARLKLDEDDVICLRAGAVTSEKPVIYYSRSYNMLNIADRQFLSPALFRLADILA